MSDYNSDSEIIYLEEDFDIEHTCENQEINLYSFLLNRPKVQKLLSNINKELLLNIHKEQLDNRRLMELVTLDEYIQNIDYKYHDFLYISDNYKTDTTTSDTSSIINVNYPLILTLNKQNDNLDTLDPTNAPEGSENIYSFSLGNNIEIYKNCYGKITDNDQGLDKKYYFTISSNGETIKWLKTHSELKYTNIKNRSYDTINSNINNKYLKYKNKYLKYKNKYI